jgi:hypothetical protein
VDVTAYSDGAVPIDRPQMSLSGILAGAPVRASDWHDLARLLHWVAGRGRVVVPAHRVALETSNAVTLRYRAPLSGRAIARVWAIEVRASGGTASAVSVAAGADPAWVSSAYTDSALGARRPIVVVEGATPLTRTTNVTELTITVTPTVGTMFIESCACWELPRSHLNRISPDLGIALDTIFARRPILDSSTAQADSVGGVARLAHDITVSYPTRRGVLLSRFGQRLDITSASPVALLRIPARVLPRRDRNPLTHCRMDIYARNSDASTSSQWRMVTGSGGAGAWVSVPLSATTPAWYSTAAVNIRCEDPDQVLGIPTAGYDTVQIEARRTAGTGALQVFGWCVYETE